MYVRIYSIHIYSILYIYNIVYYSYSICIVYNNTYAKYVFSTYVCTKYIYIFSKLSTKYSPIVYVKIFLSCQYTFLINLK